VAERWRPEVVIRLPIWSVCNNERVLVAILFCCCKWHVGPKWWGPTSVDCRRLMTKELIGHLDSTRKIAPKTLGG
jgi:hypothetical protein